MDALKWSVIDDLAHERCPDNLDAGYSEVATMAACLKEWAEPKMLLREKALVGSAVSLVPFAVATAVLWNDGQISTPIAVGLVGSWTACIATFFGLPNLGPQLMKAAGFQGPFKNPSLQPLRDHMAKLRETNRQLFDAEGNKVEWDELENDWLLYAYVADKRYRQLAISRRNRVRPGNYAGGLFVVRPSPQVIVPEFQEAEETNAAVVTNKPKGLAKPRQRHWLSLVSKRDFKKRLPLVLQFWSFVQRTQVEEILTAAHRAVHDKDTMYALKPDLKRICVKHLEAKELPLKFGDRQIGLLEESDEWIDRMLGNDKKHPYRLVRLILTDPDSAEAQEFLSELPLIP